MAFSPVYPDPLTVLTLLTEQGILTPLNIQFARFLQRLNGDTNEALLLASILVSHLSGQGHSCALLSQYAGGIFPPPALMAEETEAQLIFPPLTEWLAQLKRCRVISDGKTICPLVLHEDRLYLYRYWQYETQLATQLRHRCAKTHDSIDLLPRLQASLQRLFPDTAQGLDWQKKAAETAVRRHFCIISGGPGTGKTTTVAKILALLLEQQDSLRIALAAPTGKAAARLQDAIRLASGTLDCAANIRTRLLAQQASTLHRLLGSRYQSSRFQFNADNPLNYDVIVVDEASMVDLPLMAKLAQAIPDHARWILLGDKDQLASVEVGTVLGDLCTAALQPTATEGLRDSLVLLEKNYRFNQHSGIGQIAQQVKAGQAMACLHKLQTERMDDIQWHPLGMNDNLRARLEASLLEGFSASLQAATPAEALQAFEQFRVLCALRRGPYGVQALNRLIEQVLSTQRLIKPAQRWYHGRPLMITRNDYGLKLFNGDIGLIQSIDGDLLACFPSPDGCIRHVWPNRLPAHETAYAMTIHKSQGSEFSRVLLLLPDQSSSLLSRELLYTAITRARQRVDLWGNADVFQATVEHRIQRNSGLVSALAKNVN